VIVRYRLGEIEVFSFVENRMRLDGGAMFGVIPKKLWTREVPADGENLVELDLNLLLVKSAGKCLLVDTGFGDVATERERKIYGLTSPSRLLDSISACGVKPEDIGTVVFSHLHFDHSGGGLQRDSDGRPGTRFRRARYLAQRREWQEATHPNERTLATYVPEYMQAYEASGQVDLLDGETEIAPGVTVRPTGGHTAGHQAVLVKGGGRTLGYFADILPTRVHLKTAWVPAVDTHPLESLSVKKEILKACVEDSTWLAFDHDTELKVAQVEWSGRDYVARSLPEGTGEVVG
jgi:glyoxylase-like metal-dependent hydrolase (beta-lactamase superfamily II)